MSQLPFSAGFIALLFASVLLTGCTTSQRVTAPVQATTVSAEPESDVPVIRYGRYTLVELTPSAAQRNLLDQVVDISIPTHARPRLGDALRYTLRHSGYRLCDPDSTTSTLFALPLPGAHFHLGPLTLREALTTLTGPGWSLQVDNTTRQICFTRSPVTNAEVTVKEMTR